MATPSSETHVTRVFEASAAFNVTKDDLVAIRVAEVEKQLHEERARIVESHRLAEKARDAAALRIESVSDQVAREVIGDRFNDAILELNALIPHGTKPFETVAALTRDSKGVFIAVGDIQRDGGNISSVRTEIAVAEPFLSLVRGAYAEHTAACESIRDAERRMVEVKRKLQDIPALERQVKAAVARAVINDSNGDGARLIAALGTATLPGLPAPGV